MMNKYQFITILIAIFIGILAGGFLMNKVKEDEKQELIETQKLQIDALIEVSLDRIKSYEDSISNLSNMYKLRGDSLANLEKLIKADGVKVETKRKEARKLDDGGKRQWLIDRYKNMP